MTHTRLALRSPASARIPSSCSKVANLLLPGQGVVVFDASGLCFLKFSDASGASGFTIEFREGQILGQLEPSGEPILDPKSAKGLVTQKGAYYWVSVDAQNGRIYAGVGEPRIETAAFLYAFEPACHASVKTWMETLKVVQTEGPVSLKRVLRDPVSSKAPPLKVKDTWQLTLDSLAAGDVMPKGNLSNTMRRLYECIAGRNFVLDDSSFPQFSQAIEHSIKTPGCWCYERLAQKAAEFNKEKPDPSETYLRITLGENNGESPGIPYVMEIWPVGHYSPIHNHGGASAIIRVLHGSINVSLYPFLSADPVVPFAKADFGKDDITWISPGLNQVHQLHNKPTNKETCITIQCYMYEEDDMRHYDYFDYFDGDKSIGQFDPDSDMDFVEFKALMKKEWAEQRKWFCF